MSSRRFIIQTGMGVDQHGQNMTTAAVRAVEDAIRRNCLCGLVEIVGLQDPQQMIVEVTLAVPYPDQVDVEKVKEALPFGRKEINVALGGMKIPGLYQPKLGDKNEEYLVANAAVVVWVEEEGDY